MGDASTSLPSRIRIPGGFFDEAKHAYTDDTGRRIPSVTQVFSILGMVDYNSVSKEVLARKSALGVAVHAAVQFLCEGTLDWDTVHPDAMPYVVAAEIWMKEQGFISEAQEVQGIHEISGMRYGFMYDHRGTMEFKGRTRKVILDIKTTVVISPTCKLQTAAYALAAPKLPLGEKYLRCILQLREDGTFRPYYYEDRQDESSWQYALYTSIWMLNNKLADLAEI